MKNGQKSIRLNPIYSETTIRINPNQSETKTLIKINRNQSDLKLIQTEFPIRMNQRSEWFVLILIENSVWINPRSDWFELIWIEHLVSDWFGMIRIRSDTDIGINRNSSDWLGMNFNLILSPGAKNWGVTWAKSHKNLWFWKVKGKFWISKFVFDYIRPIVKNSIEIIWIQSFFTP